MAFAEDLSVFLNTAEFAVPVVAGAVSGVGIYCSVSFYRVLKSGTIKENFYLSNGYYV